MACRTCGCECKTASTTEESGMTDSEIRQLWGNTTDQDGFDRQALSHLAPNAMKPRVVREDGLDDSILFF